EGTKCEHVAVREVDQLDDAVDHRVAQGNQGVQSTVREPEHERLKEEGRVLEDPRQDQEHKCGNAYAVKNPGPDLAGQRHPRLLQGSDNGRQVTPLFLVGVQTVPQKRREWREPAGSLLVDYEVETVGGVVP